MEKVIIAKVEPNCSCAEASITDKFGTHRLKGADMHNCAYVKLRNAQIPEATRAANLESRGNLERVGAFARNMNRLTEVAIAELSVDVADLA